MLFNSIEFVVFFPLITLLFFALPHRYRWILLLLSSCYFYMSFIPVYILILFFTIVIDYAAGILIENARGKRRKLYLSLSIIANIGTLAFFKYYNFFIDNMNVLLEKIYEHPPELGYLAIILPIGLSFHTFQAMSYTFEVYYGRQNAERHFGIYALYVMYYPQLVAGPIERPQNILPQLRIPQSFVPARVSSGLTLMMWGMIKKVVIADKLAFFADRMFDTPENYTGPSILIGILAFTFQIYCDFSGYSDIARGASRVMGIELMINFNRPYFSTSIHEFWQRWHISLSTWFRDYLYIPLGGNRNGRMKWIRNLLIVFLISGLWHGSSWNFIIWGILHGSYTIIFLLLFLNQKRSMFSIHKSIGWLCTFTLVSITWVFFRATTLPKALMVFKQLFTGWDVLATGIDSNKLFLNFTTINWISAIAATSLLFVIEWLSRDNAVEDLIKSKPRWQRYSIYYLGLTFLYLFGVYKQSSFIYFQF